MDSNDLSRLYEARFPKSELQRKNAIWRVLCSGFLQRFVGPADTIVDIACGHGEFLNNIKAGKKIGVDLNPEAKKCLSAEVEFHQLNASGFAAIVKGRADVVFTSNVLEHLPDKRALELFLDQVLLALKPGGAYLVLGPNLRYLPGKYWDFYDHHLGLTHLSLIEVLQMKGFAIETCIPRFLPFTTQGALPTHPLLVKAYLGLPPAWKLFGKQFFIVARKPAG